MKDFRELLRAGNPLLVVSLPENSADFARAAVEAGADAVKLHCSVTHKVTKKTHAPWGEVRELAASLCAGLDAAVGIVPGSPEILGPAELAEMAAVGLSFFDAYIEALPVHALDSGLCALWSLGHGARLETARHLAAAGAEAVEASVVASEEYGTPLMASDLANYHEIAESSRLPVFVPSQRKLRPEDCPRILAMGARGIILGAVVTGSEIRDFGARIGAFARAMGK
jgi:hypothetical protein